MNCAEFRTRLHPYVDGELPVSETAAADAHGVECRACAELARSEREFRRVLRRQPRDVAPPELRARIVGRVRRQARWRSVPTSSWSADARKGIATSFRETSRHGRWCGAPAS